MIIHNNIDEINRKRKNFHTHFENPYENLLEEDDDDEFLELSLVTPSRSTRPRIQPRENLKSSTLNLRQCTILKPAVIPKETVQSSCLDLQQLNMIPKETVLNLQQLTTMPKETVQSSTLNLQQLNIIPKETETAQSSTLNHQQILKPIMIPKETIQRRRRNSSKPKLMQEVKIETVTPPFPWATNSIATVHTLQYLLSKQLIIISGDVQCRRCEKRYTMEFDLKEKFVEIGSYVMKNKTFLKERAPSIWANPILPTCQFCNQENSAKPIICSDKNKINWLFLLLGQMLGCCTLDELKFFCEHTNNHRTGAKDRVLFLTYLTLCRQVDPTGPFHR